MAHRNHQIKGGQQNGNEDDGKRNHRKNQQGTGNCKKAERVDLEKGSKTEEDEQIIIDYYDKIIEPNVQKKLKK